ncbi:MAG: hypothetical protein WED82_05890, partial [Balneolales bacterium]
SLPLRSATGGTAGGRGTKIGTRGTHVPAIATANGRGRLRVLGLLRDAYPSDCLHSCILSVFPLSEDA